MPGVGFAERQLAVVEQLALRELRLRLDRAAGPPGEHGRALPGPARASGAARSGETLADTLDRLLRRSMDQTPGESVRSLFENLLDELVPDEARILAALSDGSVHPLVHVTAPGSSRRIVENASSVGRAAGVAAPGMVPAYVTHLLRIGLVQIGEEDTASREEYDILITDASVRDACEEVRRAGGRRAPRITRETVRMTALGHELWTYCRDGAER
jgi:hypothetical protein